MDMAIIGIDLGTTNSLVVVWENGESKIIKNQSGSEITPSVVSVEDGKILVGQSAKERLVTHPDVTVAGFKRYMGMKKTVQLGPYTFSPEELSSLVIKKLKEDAEKYLGEEVEEAIISVPAYFNNDQRYATKVAAKLAGVVCNRIINEPSAAALSCRMKDMSKEQTVLVVDFGGGTLDVSVVECFENIVEIQSIAGDNHLGGKDFDELIARKFCKENGLDFEQLTQEAKGSLLRRAEHCKIILSQEDSSTMYFRYQDKEYNFVFTNDILTEISGNLLLRLKKVMNKAMKDCGKRPNDITDILPVGGTCQMPVIHDYLAHLFHRPLKKLQKGDRIVAKGLGVYCGIKAQNNEIKDILLTDVCPFSLGTDISNYQNPSMPIMSVIIERNTVLPIKVSRMYTTTSEAPTFDIYQGEGYYAKENVKIGCFGIEDLPNEIKGQKVSVELIFSYDINGILEVTARVKETEQEKSIVIVSYQNPLTKEEIEEKRKRMKNMNFADAEENQEVIALATRIYQESVKDVRDEAYDLLYHFLFVLRTNSPIKIKKEREKILQRLHELGNYVDRDVFEFCEGMDDDLYEEMDYEVELRAEKDRKDKVKEVCNRILSAVKRFFTINREK